MQSGEIVSIKCMPIDGQQFHKMWHTHSRDNDDDNKKQKELMTWQEYAKYVIEKKLSTWSVWSHIS